MAWQFDRLSIGCESEHGLVHESRAPVDDQSGQLLVIHVGGLVCR